MAEFDNFSGDYREVLNKSVRISGYGADYFAEYKARYAFNLLSNGFKGKILDYGCGVGLLSEYLKKYFPGSILHGYDTSSASIDKIDSFILDQGIFTTQRSQLDQDYDLIVVSNVLHHIPVKVRQDTFEEFRKYLPIGGKLLVFEHNPFNPFTRWIVKHCPLDRHASLLTSKMVQTFLSLTRFQRIRLEYIMFFPRPLSLFSPLERIISWCPLGAQYAIVGEKN
jgi:cyclopropane fatty-acyl-phospholipid synthase-like methyltransferase